MAGIVPTATVSELSARHVCIGAGVVGLAVAKKLAGYGSTVLLERHAQPGQETSARNSEVIHGGMMYNPESLKTKLCILGRKKLYKTCEKNGIPHKRIGKWIVAQDEHEVSYLHKVHEKAKSLGVPTFFLSSKEIQSGEPLLRVKSALCSPETGIIDSHEYMNWLESQIQELESDIAYNTHVVGVSPNEQGGYVVEAQSSDGKERFRVSADVVVNSAGLASDKVARMAMGSACPESYRLHYCRGVYFGVRGKALVSRLIYPTPEHNLVGLGIHATLDMAGHMRLGPDTEYIPDINYTVDESRLEMFWKAATRYLPSITKESLSPDYAGIRPKLAGPGQPARDFIIQEESARGFPGLVNLIGIESPGLTASLAIADHVAGLLGYGPEPEASS